MDLNQISSTPSPSSSAQDPLTLFVSKLKRTRSPRALQLHQKRMSYLALHFDPFSPTPDPESQQIIGFYQLGLVLQNPYQFTNVILQMLDLLEERTKTLA